MDLESNRTPYPVRNFVYSNLTFIEYGRIDDIENIRERLSPVYLNELENYDYNDFLNASCGSDYDIFRCRENDNFYVPTPEGIFEYI